LEEARESPNILEKYFSTSQTEQLQKILSEKKESQKALKKTFKLSSNSPDGLNDIKAILSIDKEQSKIQYLGSSKFSIAVSHNNPKEAEKILQSVLEQIEKSAKQKHSLFSIKEK
jgi:translation initiation factor 2 alpha subunit (eIF-2alpha)